jgi:hypothetical protein
MTDKKQKQNFNEHIDKLKYKMNYGINEAPLYRKITEEDFGTEDTLPDQFVQAEPSPDAPAPATGTTTPAPASGATTPVPAPADPNAIAGDPQATDPMAAEQSVDKIQNDIIRQNLTTMEMIHNKLEQLETTVQNLNQEYQKLNADVEEVREPTSGEKLMSKKEVSYPYYYNLNDVWKGNWFEEQRKKDNDGGIRELPDGTFIADFDDLPEFSKTDISQSFSKIS